MEDKKITVDLTKPLSSGKVDASSLLQVKARENLDSILNKFVEHSAVNSFDCNKETNQLVLEFDNERLNNTIFISGQRGAGKTTFLKTVLLEKLKNTTDKILPIAFIDPTLINTNQHILVDIIAKFKQVIDAQLPVCGHENERNRFNKALEEMAEGLKLLKGNGGAVEKDAAWFLNKALKHAISGQNLESKFHHLIDITSKLLGKSLFVIAIDDVDNDTTKAYEVLELIRRYLTHSKLTVIISGDLKLYSHIVKQRKIKELKVGGDSKDTAELVDHLEQQYLAKVLPIEQRVELKSLNNLIQLDNQKINIHLTNGQQLELREHLKSIFSDSLNLHEKYVSIYIRFYLKQPVRTAFQILKNTHDKSTTGNVTSLRRALISSIQNSYVGALKKENIDIDKLVNSDIHQNAIGLALFELCSKYSELETGFYARPDGIDESYNASQLFISQVIANYLSDEKQHSIGNAIKLMLTTGASANIFMNHVVDKLKPNKKAQEYVNYIGLNRDQNLFSFTAHFSPFVFSKDGGKTRAINGGIARLPRSSAPGVDFSTAINEYYGVDGVNTKIATLNNLVSTHDKDDVTFTEYLSAKTVLIASHSMIAKSEGRDYISAYCLLATLGEFLTCNDNEITQKLTQLSSIQTFGGPAFADIEAEGEGVNDEDGASGDNDDESRINDHHSKAVTLILAWKKVSNNASLSPLLIGKIWSRVMYSIANVSDVAKKQKVKNGTSAPRDILLGTLLSRFVFSIVNAVLIEEVRFSKNLNPDLISKFSKSKNVASSSNELLTNLKGALSAYPESSKMEEALPITTSLITCPLLWPYLGEWISKNNGTGVNPIFCLIFEVIESVHSAEGLETIFSNEFESMRIGNFQRGLKFVSRLPITGCKYEPATPKTVDK